MDANTYAEEWRCKSMGVLSATWLLAVQLSMESGDEQAEHGDNHGRPDPQPQEPLKNARPSDVIRWKGFF